MNKLFFFSIVFAIIYTSESKAATYTDSLSIAPFGKVFIYKPTTVPLNVVIMISGDAGWKSGVIGFAETFSEMNNLVIGVDILRYFKDLRQRTEDCYSVASDFIELATVIEKKYNFPDYRPPVIIGYSSGATLVYGILAQARPGAFIGGLSLGFCPDIELPKMLCQTNGLTEKVDVTGKSYFLQPDAKLGNPWIVLQGKLDIVCNYSTVVDFVGKTTDAELITLPKVGHGFSNYNDFMPQWKEAFNRLVTNFNSNQTKVNNLGQGNDLPVVITNVKFQNKDLPVAFMISGDGGWYWFEQSIADKLAELGIPVVGLDSRKYFWNRKTPDETATAVTKTLSYYCTQLGRTRIMFIGYSLGAEIVPFIVNRLPDEMKSMVVSSVLLSPDISTDFEIHISNMLGMGNRQNTYEVADEINKMQSTSTLCIFGEDEKSEVPGLLKGNLIKTKLIPGDHHYKNNTSMIVQVMKDYKAY